MNQRGLPVFLIVLLLLGLGVLLRLLWLTGVPNGLNRDELVMGYDAYCLLKTGKDHWGAAWPFFFRGLNGYQPGIFPYTTLFWVALLGPADWAIRLTPFLYGTLTLLTTFFLTRRWFETPTALWALFFLAIAPWHIFYSRFGNPNILVPLFHTAALLFFFKGIEEKKKSAWLLAGLFFGLAFHSYYGAYIIIPLSLLGLALVFAKELWQQKGNVVLGLVVGVILLLPHIYHALYGDILARGSLILFTDKNLTFFEALRQFFKNYLFLFSPEFLFSKGHQTGGEWLGKHGMLYWMELPFLILGLACLLYKREKKGLFLLWWLLIYPVQASLTGDSDNNPLRTSVALPVFQIITAVGAARFFRFVWSWKKESAAFNLWLRRIVVLAFCMVVVVSVQRFSRKYFIRYPYKYAPEAQYGMKEMAHYLRDKIDQYDRIVISGYLGDPARRRPAIFLAYYLPIEPSFYQQMEKGFSNESVAVDFWKFKINHNYNRLHKPKPGERVLYVVEEGELSDADIVHHRIYYPDGNVVYKICEYLPGKFRKKS